MKKIKNVKNKLKLKNSFGSISFLGENRRRPFMLRAPAIYTDDGKAIRKVIDYVDDWYEGLEVLLLYNKNPYDVDKKNIIFYELVMMWSEHEIRKNNAKPEAERKKKAYSPNYDSVFNNQCKTLWNEKIIDITIAKIQNCVDECEHGYSTIKYIKLLCKKVFKYAKYLGIDVDMDNVNFVEIGTSLESDLHINFTQDEISMLWHNLGNKNIDPFEIIDSIIIAIYTGMRPTEMLTVLNEKVYLDKKFLVAGIKTAAGIDRDIPINSKVIPLIQKRINLKNTFLITDKNNNPYNYRHYLDLFKSLMNKLNMKHLPHDCRDTTATELYNNSVKSLIIKLILGHSVNDVTEKYYVNITLEQKLKAINTIE